jgi:hypothetical protein
MTDQEKAEHVMRGLRKLAAEEKAGGHHERANKVGAVLSELAWMPDEAKAHFYDLIVAA